MKEIKYYDVSMKKLFTLIALISVALNLLAHDATIGNIWVDHNNKDYGAPLMIIHLALDVKGAKGKTFKCRARFYDRNGNYQAEINKKNKGKEFSPPYDSSVYKDFKIIVGNHEFDIPYATTKKFYFQIEVVDDNNRIIAKSDPYYFYANCPDNKKMTSGGYYAYNFDMDKTTWDANDRNPAHNNSSSSYNYSTSGVSTGQSNGYIPRESLHGDATCSSCNGSGLCTSCQGKGWYENQYYDYKVFDCSICHKSGKCQVCHGKGTIHY